MNTCLYCNNEVKNKFCNTSCQNKYQNPLRKKKSLILICQLCNKLFLQSNRYYRKRKFCSLKCSSINANNIKTLHGKYKWSDESRKKLSDIMKKKNSNASRIWKKETLEKLSKIGKEKHGKEYWTPERRKRHSEIMNLVVEKNPNSYSSNSVCGRAKTIEMVDSFGNKVKLKGTWEKIVADFLNDNSIQWTKKVKWFEYFWNKSIHKYFPDFYLPNIDRYIEVKGYERERDICKWSVVNNLIILKKEEINLIKNKKYTAGWTGCGTSTVS